MEDKNILNIDELKKLILQNEKLAHIGQLTAGILHEIKNPLNFVSNFTKLSLEFENELNTSIEKLNTKVDKKETEDISETLELLFQNIKKIQEHSKRAERIVFGMLASVHQGPTEPFETDLNQLVEDYFKLAYHGVRGENSNFNAKLNFVPDTTIGLVKIIPSDFGRVILNIVNNACYALNTKTQQDSTFAAEITVTTQKIDDKIRISIKDNGTGIPQNIIDKIYQPFFTTKPTGKGTGLGLAMSLDIVENTHKGKLIVTSKENEFTEFIIEIPVK